MKNILTLLLMVGFLNGHSQVIVKGKRAKISTPPPAQRLYTTHLMNALTSHGDSLQGWVNYMVNVEGHNSFWLFGDYYYGGTTAFNVMDAIGNAGATVMMGNQFSNVPAYNSAAMIIETWDHPALYKYNGKRVYHGYDTQEFPQAVKDSLALHGIYKSDFYYWVNTRYPNDFTRTLYENCTSSTTTYKVNKGNNIQVGLYVHIPGGTNRLITSFSTLNPLYDSITVASSIGVAALAGASMEMWYENFSVVSAQKDVEHIFDVNPDVDGIVNFAVDKGTSSPSGALAVVNNENIFLSQAAVAKNKVAVAGINKTYASAQYTDYGFSGLLSPLKNILSLPLSQWPLGICETTANDGVERSNMSRAQNPPDANGLSFVPNLSAGYTLGATFSYPLLDNSGINKFIRPWIEKFKNSDTTPVTFSADRIFSSYLLHPIQASYVATIPAYLNANWPSIINGMSKAAYWATTFYATGDSKTDGIKLYMDTAYEHIRMAAHLTSPAILRITIGGTNYDSPLRSGPDAYWEIPLGTKRGTPSFSIVRGGVVVKTGTGVQAITDFCYPGGWNLLTMEM